MTNITESYNLQSPLKVEIEWCRQSDTPPITLSISALLLNKETNLVDKMEDFVFYGTPTNDGKNITSKGGGIKCDSLNFKKGFGTSAKYNMTIDLKKIDTEISKIRIIASIVPKDTSDKDVPGFDNLSKARCILTDGVGSVYKCDLEREADALCRSVDIAIVQRWDKNWRFSEELNFHTGGLDFIYGDDSYVSQLISNSNPFEDIGNIVRIEEMWKLTKTATRIGKAGQRIRTTVTTVLRQCTETLGIPEGSAVRRGHIPKRRPQLNSTEQGQTEQVKQQAKKSARVRGHIINRKAVDEEPQKDQMQQLTQPSSSNKRGRVLRRNNSKEQKTNEGKSGQETNSTPVPPVAGESKHDVSRKHPIARRK